MSISYKIVREDDKHTWSEVYYFNKLTNRKERYGHTLQKQRKMLCSGGPNDKHYYSIAQLDNQGTLMTRRNPHGYAIYNRRDSYFGKESSLFVWFPA